MSARGLPWERPGAGSVAAALAADTARRIVEGELAAGDTLTEVGIAEQAGSSRTPVREAMLQLEAWGLVRIAPKKGATVTALTWAERRDLLETRTMFESAAAGAVAGDDARREALAAALRGELERQRSAVVAGDALAFAGADYGFHACIGQALGNEVVAGMYDVLGPRFARLTYQVAIERPQRLPAMLGEHKALADALERGAVAAFGELLRAHLRAGHGADEAGRLGAHD